MTSTVQMKKLDIWTVSRHMRAVFAQDTAETNDWKPENPSAGHCHVSALILNKLYGGKIVTSYALIPNYTINHYWNVIGGVTLDITRDQFDTKVTSFTPAFDCTHMLLARETMKKRNLLFRRLKIRLIEEGLIEAQV